MQNEQIDLIVGIPSYNEADTIPFVTRQADAGITTYFPNLNARIVNADNNSPDGTRESFLGTETETEKVYLTTAPGVKGKGNNFFNLFNYAHEVGAKSVVVVDADLKSITPEWIEKLATPTMNGTAFVSPLYLRHKYDGTITNSLVFPLVFSLMNKLIRQPIGGDFSVRGDLIAHYLSQEWTETIRQYGVDIFMTFHALLGGFPIEQVHLGAKIHKPSAPKLGPMFVQVITTLFDMITSNGSSLSQSYNGNRPIADYSLPDIEPPDIDIDVEKVRAQSCSEFAENRDFLATAIDPDLFKRIESAFSDGDIDINAELWADIVFEFLHTYETSENRPKLIEAFKSLYWGRAFTFITRTLDLSSSNAEELIIRQAEVFWDKRKNLVNNGG